MFSFCQPNYESSLANQVRAKVDSPVSNSNLNINKQLIKRKSLERKEFEVKADSRMSLLVNANQFAHNIHLPGSFVYSKSKPQDETILKRSVISSLIKPRFQNTRFSIGKDTTTPVGQLTHLIHTDQSRAAAQVNTSASLGRRDTLSFQEQQMSSSRISREGRRTQSKSNVLIRYRQTSEAADNSYTNTDNDAKHDDVKNT